MTSDLDDTMDSQLRARRPAPHGRLRRGARLGRYTVTAALGEGGMGIVYAAYDAELDRKVALKLLHPRHGGTEGGSARERLIREAQAMAKLDHPNVVTVFDAGVVGEQTYVAMELVLGETLGRWLGRARPRWQEIVGVFVAAGRGLVAAHAEGLVHRDFKPDNVMIGPGTRVRVMDFGLARAAPDPLSCTADDRARPAPPAGDDDTPPGGVRSPVAPRVTRTGAMVGTPAYMAPEQFAMEESGPATDQFSFCVALWEALHGRRPFVGDTIAELGASVMAGRVARLPAGVGAPRWLRRVLMRGLAVEPARRWPSMASLLAALERGLARRRWAQVAVAAGVGALGFGAVQLVEAMGVRAEHQACAQQATAVDAVWNDATKDRLHAALVPADAAVAPGAFDRAVAIGDGIAQQWTATYRAACDAGVVAPEPDEPWAQTRACLAELHGRFGMVLDVLGSGEVATGVQRFAPMLLRLDPPTACLDADFRGRPTAGDDALRPMLWRVEALERAGVIDETLERAAELTGLAEAAGRADIVARAELLAAAALSDRGDHEAAHARLQAVFDRALADGDDPAAISASAALVSVAGVKLSRDAEGQLWARIGGSLVVRSDATRSFPALRLGNAIGLLHRAHGRLAEAERAHQEGLAIKRGLYGPEHPDVVLSLDNLGLVYLDQGRVAEATAAHREVLALREAALGPDHADVATTLNNLATALERAGDYDGAIAALERALQIRERAFGPTSRMVGAALINLGLSHERRGEHPQAEAYLLRALAIYASGEPDLAKLATVHNNLGLVHRSGGRRDRALEDFTATLELRRKLLAPDHPLLAAAYNNLGLVASETGDLDGAQRWYEQALAIYDEHGGVELATTHANLGDVFRQRGRLADATRSFTRSVEVLETLIGPETVDVAFGLLGLARIALDQGDGPTALRHAERALAARERSSVDPILVAEARFITAQARVLTGARAEGIALGRAALATIDSGAGEGWPTLREEVVAWLAGLDG